MKQKSDLIDPDDPLATNGELIGCALDVLEEIRSNISDENNLIPMVIDTDPEWLDASLDYLKCVLEALKERTV